MGSTSQLHLRYPESTDAPNAPQQFRNLAEDVEGVLAPLGQTTGVAWTAYTPTWLAAGTPIGYGSGSIREGRWIRIGRTIFGHFNFVWGTGLTPGSSHYLFGLPVPAVTTSPESIVIGQASINRAPTASEIKIGIMLGSGVQDCVIRAEAAYLVGATAPYTWASGNAIRGSFMYEAAS